MSTVDPAQREALVRLGASTAEAIAQVLEMVAPGEITCGDVSVLPTTTSPFAGVEPGSVAAGVSYVDGVTGANVFIAPRSSARALAQRMGVPLEGEPDDELSELELSAVSEASNQMMATAASAIGVVLGQEIEISPPLTRVIDGASSAEEVFGSAPHATSTTFFVGGEPCRLIQLVPSAFVVRMTRALDELEGEVLGGGAGGPGVGDAGTDRRSQLAETLNGVQLRVWAELGRTTLPLGDARGMPLGAVVELDRTAEEPIDLFVNGVRFARGRLLVSDEGRWVFQLDEMTTPHLPSSPPALTCVG